MSLTSAQVALAWADSVEGCIVLNDYCHANFGKLPTIFLGLDVNDMPGAKDAPYVVLNPFGARGGLEAGQTEIQVRVGVGAGYKTKPTTDGRRVTFTAAQKMEEELWPLVRQALEDSGADFAPQEIEMEMDAPDGGFLELRAACVVTQENTID